MPHIKTGANLEISFEKLKAIYKTGKSLDDPFKRSNLYEAAIFLHLQECTTEETQPAADPDDLAQLAGLFTKPGL